MENRKYTTEAKNAAVIYDENSQLGEDQNISGKEVKAVDSEDLGQLEQELKVNMECRRGNLANGQDYSSEDISNGLTSGEIDIYPQEIDDLDVKNLDGTADPYKGISPDDDR